jgi:hypothetical protein
MSLLGRTGTGMWDTVRLLRAVCVLRSGVRAIVGVLAGAAAEHTSHILQF